MQKYIYKITSPSGKIYIGQSTIPPDRKINYYANIEKYCKSNRKISSAIKKYSWNNMIFEIIDSNDSWSNQDLNDREIFWISHYNSVEAGYNITAGGDGVDSNCARELALRHHRTMTEDKKEQRRKNCSKGQKKRFQENPETDLTRKRKSDAHKGTYQIISPDGKSWITDLGLKEFSELYQEEIKVSYWVLFGAYRKCYTNRVTTKKRKDNNHWIVTRLDKLDN